ncbi:acyl-CoA thioesterase [Cycloclasticus pugetii]|jgi:acyl-CoA thioester hydrolase|nr:thioesterase family protein [Cycloclasticus pugetii]SHJ52190.1 Acyl-CoA thioesterase FadM [Cycloclasticus pugetii]|tara:strand:+ start:13457 stop:13882 length:426 start_codon:yes stop_codon:yes gene_type:complete
MTRLSITYPEHTLFSCTLPVRIGDINYGQHLAHDKLISMLHEARAQFFIHVGMQESNIAGLGIIMADLSICYQAEAFHPDQLNIDIAIEDPSRCGFNMLYQVSKNNGETIIATAKTGLLFMDYHKKKISAMPKEFKQLIDP